MSPIYGILCTCVGWLSLFNDWNKSAYITEGGSTSKLPVAFSLAWMSWGMKEWACFVSRRWSETIEWSPCVIYLTQRSLCMFIEISRIHCIVLNYYRVNGEKRSAIAHFTWKCINLKLSLQTKKIYQHEIERRIYSSSVLCCYFIFSNVWK